jgi:hypothetical protein
MYYLPYSFKGLTGFRGRLMNVYLHPCMSFFYLQRAKPVRPFGLKEKTAGRVAPAVVSQSKRNEP